MKYDMTSVSEMYLNKREKRIAGHVLLHVYLEYGMKIKYTRGKLY
jgi:hypothetical protein